MLRYPEVTPAIQKPQRNGETGDGLTLHHFKLSLSRQKILPPLWHSAASRWQTAPKPGSLVQGRRRKSSWCRLGSSHGDAMGQTARRPSGIGPGYAYQGQSDCGYCAGPRLYSRDSKCTRFSQGGRQDVRPVYRLRCLPVISHLNVYEEAESSASLKST